MSSATEPAATSRPLSITTAWVQVCSTSASTWLENNTVAPVVRRPGARVGAPRASPAGRARWSVRRARASRGGRAAPGEPEPLAHALRVGLHLAVDGVAEIGDGERLVDVGVGPLGAARLPPQAQVAQPREVRHERADSMSAPTRRSWSEPGFTGVRRTASPRRRWAGSDRGACAGTWSSPRRSDRAGRTTCPRSTVKLRSSTASTSR